MGKHLQKRYDIARFLSLQAPSVFERRISCQLLSTSVLWSYVLEIALIMSSMINGIVAYALIILFPTPMAVLKYQLVPFEK